MCPDILVSHIPPLGVLDIKHSWDGHSDVATLEINTDLGQDHLDKNQGL